MQREVAIILKVKNAAEVRKELKDVFNRGTTAAVGSYNKAITKTDTKQKRVARSAKRAGRGVKSFGNVLMGSVASLYAYNRAFTSTMQLMDKGASLERVGEVFKKTVGSLEVALPALRKATRGAIADFNLMKTANRAVVEGISPDKLGSFFKMASMASEKLAINRTDAINMVTRAITRQDVSAMKSLGIISKTDKALNVQMGILSKIGKIAAPAMRIQATHDFVIKGLTARYGQFNALFMDNMLLLERSKTAWTNLKASIGSALIQAFKPLLLVIPRALNSVRDFLNTISTNESLGTFTNHLLSFGAALASIAAAMSGLKLFKLMGVFFGFNSVIKLGISTIVGYAFGIKDLGAALGTAFTMGKVFFALLQSYNSGTGLSSIAKKDADSLGSLYGVVLGMARVFKVVQAAGTGAFLAIKDIILALKPVLGSVSGAFGSIIDAISGKTAIAQSDLDKIRDWFRDFGRYVTGPINSITRLINKVIEFKRIWNEVDSSRGFYEKAKAVAQLNGAVGGFIMDGVSNSPLGSNKDSAGSMKNNLFDISPQNQKAAQRAGLEPLDSIDRTPTAAPQNILPTQEDEVAVKQLKILTKMEKHLETKNQKDDEKKNEYSFNPVDLGNLISN